MEALRNLVSPLKKKPKVQMELSDSDVELQEDVEEMKDAEKIDEEEVPKWAVSQSEMLAKLMDTMDDIKKNIGTIKDEVAQVRFQAGVAQAVADEAIEKIDDVETRVFERLEALEAKIPSIAIIQNMIEETLSKVKREIPKQHSSQTTTSNRFAHGSNEEKFSRTIVVGGFERDTPKRTLSSS